MPHLFKKLNQLICMSAISLLCACAANITHDTTTQHINESSMQKGANQDWPSFGRDYANKRFSKNKQINTSNIHHLIKAWEFKSGIKNTFQATPIVVNGMMYVSLPYNHVVALDAKSGKEIWRYQHERRQEWNMCCGPANRGVAVGYGKVFIGTVDSRLIALDSNSGKKLWDIDAVESPVITEGQETLNENDPNSHAKTTGGTGVGMAMAPIVYNGKVIIGITGVGYGLHIDNPREDAPLGAVIGVTGRYGRPGFLAAFDVNTGKRVWQFDTIPENGWEGDFTPTTSDGIFLNRDIDAEKASLKDYPESGRFGGGSAWTTPAIDVKHGLLYFGTGNPSPQMNDVSRPGDNLYTVSLIALDANTGKLRWHYQQVPHDIWGYDLASPPILFNYEYQGKSIPAVGQASKLGWFYVNHRLTGELLIKSDAFVPQKNLFAKASFEGVTLYPGILGGSNWSPAAIDEKSQRAFVAAIHAPIKYTLHETPGKDGAPPIQYAASEPADEPRWGILSAIDLSTGKIVWQNKIDQPMVGGVLVTEGGLLFTGEGNGNFNAYDTRDGKLLWQDKNDYGVNAPPITYQIDHEQYVAVAAGGSAIFGYKQGDSLRVYKLKK
jgi:glucose dehydrogenase